MNELLDVQLLVDLDVTLPDQSAVLGRLEAFDAGFPELLPRYRLYLLKVVLHTPEQLVALRVLRLIAKLIIELLSLLAGGHLMPANRVGRLEFDEE